MATKPDASGVTRRILLVIAELASGKQGEFAELTGINASTLSRILSGGQPAKDEHLRLIEEKTLYRFEWLKKGDLPMRWPNGQLPSKPEEKSEGEMLRTWLDRNGVTQVELSHRLNRSKTTVNQYLKSKSIDSKNKTIILAALGAKYDDVFGSDSSTPENRRLNPVRIDETNLVSVLRIPIRARAGFGYEAYFAAHDADREYLAIPLYKLYPGVKPDLHVIVEVNGDSMEPVMEHGYEVLAYQLSPGKFPAVNKIVLVDFRDELTIKRLAAVDWVNKTVMLRSDNGGAEMLIPMDDIRTVWHVYDYYKARL